MSEMRKLGRTDPGQVLLALITAAVYLLVIDLALSLGPRSAEAEGDQAWTPTAKPAAQVRDGRETIALAERACKLTEYKQPSMVGTRTPAYAEACHFAGVVIRAEKAITLAE
jgi:hypothetical protein